MSYLAFARKYRPQTFDDIAGQSHVTTTLKNAISQDRVAHAYIFAGPRGVGKTTAARILAKALNCEKGPRPLPCNACNSCKEITKGSNLDVIEIDGASNRGIDEIRSLRENVKFAPSGGRFKIYIIDEVHMLTAEAFNALLKTLEEPPKHVKFIFATTQSHKVPPTILSRCQKFDFRRIASREIAENLKRIVKAEKLNIGDDAIMLVAKHSDGGMRDAQVVLDQIASWASGKISAGDVTKMLGLVEDEAFFELSGSISKKDASLALGVLDRLINEGKDTLQIILGLIEHFRNISIAKIAAEPDRLIDTVPDKIKRYKDEAHHFTIEDILYCIYTLSSAIDFIKRVSLSRIPLEAALVKLTLKGSIVPLDELMNRIEALGHGGNTAGRNIDYRPKAAEHKPKEPETNNLPKGPETKAGGGLDEVIGVWSKIINNLMEKKISVATYLQEGYPASMEGKTLSISFPRDLQFHKEVLESADNKRLIEDAIKTVAGLELRIAFTLVAEAPGQRRKSSYSDNDDASGVSSAEDGSARKEVDPILKSALEIFGGNMSEDDPQRRRAR